MVKTGADGVAVLTASSQSLLLLDESRWGETSGKMDVDPPSHTDRAGPSADDRTSLDDHAESFPTSSTPHNTPHVTALRFMTSNDELGGENSLAASSTLQKPSQVYSISSLQSMDFPPRCPLALKDRSNHGSSSDGDSNEDGEAEKFAVYDSRPKRSHHKTMAPTPLILSPCHSEDVTPRVMNLSQTTPATPQFGKRRKETGAELTVNNGLYRSERRKNRQMLVAATNGVQLMRSSAQFLESTWQSAVFCSTLGAQQETPKMNSRCSLSPQKRRLPSAAQVEDIRQLVRTYTLLDPLDRLNSKQALRIQTLTGYTLNPPSAPLINSLPLRSPIRTRAAKLESLLNMDVDVLAMDSCKLRDQRLTEASTQCRYERDGNKFVFHYMPSGMAITATQYEARYNVMLEQLCKIRSDYWSEYFAVLAAAQRSRQSTVGKEEGNDELPSTGKAARPSLLGDTKGSYCDASTRVLVGGDDAGQWNLGSVSTRVLVDGDAGDNHQVGKAGETTILLQKTPSPWYPSNSRSGLSQSHYASMVASCTSATSLATGQVLVSWDPSVDEPDMPLAASSTIEPPSH
jgi:hypothetical protein